MGRIDNGVYPIRQWGAPPMTAFSLSGMGARHGLGSGVAWAFILARSLAAFIWLFGMVQIDKAWKKRRRID